MAKTALVEQVAVELGSDHNLVAARCQLATVGGSAQASSIVVLVLLEVVTVFSYLEVRI